MASMQKFTHHDVTTILRHCDRTIAVSSNQDIQKEKSSQNFRLSPDRGMTDYYYYKERKSQLYCYNRKDVVTMVGWIVTLPKDTRPQDRQKFFQVVYQFLEERYGKENVVQSIVHMDEVQPHLHFNFIPVVPDKKHGGGKICAAERMNRKELKNFHPALQKYLREHGVSGTAHSGITRQQGGNRPVSLLKQLREQEKGWTRCV